MTSKQQAAKRRGATVQDRLFAKRHISETGCWEYTGWCNNKGYGMIGIGGRAGSLQLCHRVSYKEFVGEIPDKMFVLHKCDNPKCFNPDHLFLGTHSDNMKDKVAKGRANSLSGEASPNCKLTKDQVEEIRERYIPAAKRGRWHRGNASSLAEEYGVSQEYIYDLVRRKWRKNG